MSVRELLDSPLWQALDSPIVEADCVAAMRLIPDCSIDAICTDPPYGLEFMGKGWDRLGATVETVGSQEWDAAGSTPFGGGGQRGSSARSMQAWHEEWAREALRILKPGGHLLAFGGSRTYHRLACAVEDAGFEIRDSIAYVSVPPPIDLLREWIEWTERNAHAGLRLVGQGGDSVPGPVLLSTSLEGSPATALIAELRSIEAHRTDAASWRSALSRADTPTTESSALVTIAGNRLANPDATFSTGSTAPNGVLDWLDASTEHRTRAVEALKIWRGSEQSSKRAATGALCAALTDALKAITCAQSETFRRFDMTSRMVCVSATTATTTASTAAHLISFMVDTLEHEGGDASEVSPSGPLLWIYGSGFPLSKSLDVSKAIDRAAGAEREIVANGQPFGRGSLRNRSRVEMGYRPTELNPDGGAAEVTAPSTLDAAEWEGWGTALKPAHEPIVVARKPLAGTVITNVLEHGTGALNIDGCRVAMSAEDADTINNMGGFGRIEGHVPNDVYGAYGPAPSAAHDSGRWPANVVLAHHEDCVPVGTRKVSGHKGYPNGPGGKSMHYTSDARGESVRPDAWHGHADADGMETVESWDCVPGCPVRALDEQSGELTSGKSDGFTGPYRAAVYGRYAENRIDPATIYGDSGGASRFFYVAKASTAERTAGLDGFTAQFALTMGNGIGGKEHDPETATRKLNQHPTVKPVELMRWLVRLVTPPGGIVLDPFAGSGTTVCAAAVEGVLCVGLERQGPLFAAENPGSDDYASVARARAAWWASHPEGVPPEKMIKADRAQRKVAATGQASIFDVFDD